MSVKVYVEGGGDSRELRAKCRKGFSVFFGKTMLAGRMPRIIASGSRENAYDNFCHEFANATENDCIFLLVDSEGPVPVAANPWPYLKDRDHWDRPPGAEDSNVHLMVQCMEAWFLSDKNILQKFFGNGFNLKALPRRTDIENISKNDLEKGLKNATRQCKSKGEYHKGRHSFSILAELDPDKIITASSYAKRLIDTLTGKLAD